jgi:hypothetical protein
MCSGAPSRTRVSSGSVSKATPAVFGSVRSERRPSLIPHWAAACSSLSVRRASISSGGRRPRRVRRRDQSGVRVRPQRRRALGGDGPRLQLARRALGGDAPRVHLVRLRLSARAPRRHLWLGRSCEKRVSSRRRAASSCRSTRMASFAGPSWRMKTPGKNGLFGSSATATSRSTMLARLRTLGTGAIVAHERAYQLAGKDPPLPSSDVRTSSNGRAFAIRLQSGALERRDPLD